MKYRLTFRDDDGLPHGVELRADSDREAVAEARRMYGTTDWVLRRRRGPAMEIIAESEPREVAS